MALLNGILDFYFNFRSFFTKDIFAQAMVWGQSGKACKEVIFIVEFGLNIFLPFYDFLQNSQDVLL